MDYNLDMDEMILFETEEVDETSVAGKLSVLAVSNKNIFYAFKQSNGLFSKATYNIDKRPISTALNACLADDEEIGE